MRYEDDPPLLPESLACVSGALADAGGIVPGDPIRYGDAVRLIVAERDYYADVAFYSCGTMLRPESTRTAFGIALAWQDAHRRKRDHDAAVADMNNAPDRLGPTMLDAGLISLAYRIYPWDCKPHA